MRTYKMAVFVTIIAFVLSIASGPAQSGKKSKKPTALEAIVEKDYGALGKTTDEILIHTTTTNAPKVMKAIWLRILLKEERKGEESLSETERRLVSIYQMVMEVGDGGFDQYFGSSAGDDAMFALTGLKEIGAPGTAGILERAMSVFPAGKPPTDRSKRLAMMEKIEAKSRPAWKKCESDFEVANEKLNSLSLAYALKKRADIVLQ